MLFGQLVASIGDDHGHWWLVAPFFWTLWLAVVVTHILVAAAYVVWFRRGRWMDAARLR